MTEDNKIHLPYVLNAISKKLHALFFQKLILFDSEILQTKHLRHYDFQCEGLFTLVNFLERKTNKNQVFAFQKLKNNNNKQSRQIGTIRSSESMATPKNKVSTRANTSIEESDNSFIFSPHLKKHTRRDCKTEYFGSSLHVGDQRSQILAKLLTKVKNVNLEASQQTLHPAKSSYFNLTLGKQSVQTFQNNSQYEMVSSSHKKESRQMKRRKILEKFERIEQKIYEQPRVQFLTYVTPRQKIHTRRTKAPNTSYSVYEPVQLYDQPTQTQVMYVSRTEKKHPQQEYGGSPLSSSRSVTNINYAKQVYL